MLGFLQNYTSQIYGVLRIVSGALFACHGAQKVFGVLGGAGGSGHAAELLSLHGVAGIIELVGGILIAIGLLTRYAAFISSGQMAVAYFLWSTFEAASCRFKTAASWQSCTAFCSSTSLPMGQEAGACKGMGD